MEGKRQGIKKFPGGACISLSNLEFGKLNFLLFSISVKSVGFAAKTFAGRSGNQSLERDRFMKKLPHVEKVLHFNNVSDLI